MKRKAVFILIVLIVGIIAGASIVYFYFPHLNILRTRKAISIADPPASNAEGNPTDFTYDSINRSIDNSRRNAIVRAAEKVSPAVVSITVTQERILQRHSLFDEFYSDFWGWYSPPRRYKQQVQSLGSGAIIDKEGHILTNAHVVQNAKSIRVVLPRGEEYEGNVIGLDNTTDLAVIKIEGENLPYAKLGNSDDLIIGEWAIAFGNPFGYLLEDTEPTVTSGVVSAINRDIKRDPNQVQIFKDMIQTDAAINPGNSGGPLSNALGEVIGINTFIFTSGRGSDGIGFAIPINRAKVIVKDLIDHGQVVKAWIGAYVQKITPLLAQSLDLPVKNGVIITDIDRDSPAEKAGLQRGDIVMSSGSETINSSSDWDEIESMARPGNSIGLNILRKGKEIDLSIIPAESLSALSGSQQDKFGLFISNITSTIARQLRLESSSGVVVAGIEPGSKASSWDIENGDVIRQIGRLNVSGLDDYNDILDQIEKGDRFTLIIERKGKLFYLTVRY